MFAFIGGALMAYATIAPAYWMSAALLAASLVCLFLHGKATESGAQVMAFHLTPLRLAHAIKAYETHTRVNGLPTRRIRASLSRREAGNWALSDGHRIVAIVTPQTYVRIIQHAPGPVATSN